MPTINKLPKKKSIHNQTANRELRQKAYNTTEWRALRLSYLKQHPLCEECEKNSKVTAASSVHHIQSPFKNGTVDYELLLDPDNLESICHECHARIHNGGQSAADIIKQLDALFDENIKDEDLDK